MAKKKRRALDRKESHLHPWLERDDFLNVRFTEANMRRVASFMGRLSHERRIERLGEDVYKQQQRERGMKGGRPRKDQSKKGESDGSIS
jgi:hypothetical protein